MNYEHHQINMVKDVFWSRLAIISKKAFSERKYFFKRRVEINTT